VSPFKLGTAPLTGSSTQGDTTAYSISWLMKEIHHKDNKHLDAVNKIRAEADELGFSSSYLGYGDTPVG
jgi:hypothetical protein